MKVFSILATIFCSAIAFAYPAVNDVANLTGTYSVQGQTYPMTMKLEVVGFDGSNYTIQQTTSVLGQNNVNNVNKNSKDMITPAQMSYVLSNCAAVNATAETVTVAAGTFQTCRMVNDDVDATRVTWMGDVPFQVVKGTVDSKKDGSHIVMELQSFKNGN